MKRPLAYITAPWSNSQYENAENAAAYCRQVYDAGYSPICPVLFLPTFLKDEIPQEHKDGLDMARDYLRRSHVLVVCGHGIDETVKNDIVDEQFNPSEPDAVWVSDITYIWTYSGFVYLTSIMDLYSRKIIAWVLSQTLEAIHVVECVDKAKRIRGIVSPLVFHSDRGIQFVSQAFRAATEGMINSYSKKAYPWDNACIESFHSLLKREWLNRFKIMDYKHAYRLVFEYIETFYNTVRIHSHCGYLSPDEYEKHYWKELLKLEQKLAG